jgi:teichuronic acid biosynthesis glycosyltransferase TuaC
VKILSLSTVFPNPSERGLGLFVHARLKAIGLLSTLKVLAPIPLLDYSNPNGNIYQSRRFPMSIDGSLEVVYPRWIFPPLGTPLNVLCLFVRLYPILRRLRRTFKFDLIDAHFGYPEGVAAALLAAAFGKPFVVTLRGSEPGFARHYWRQLMLNWMFRRASSVIAVSEELRQFAVARGAAAEKVVVIPNGIDRDVFFPRDRSRVREKYNISPKRKVILSVGELIEAKGHQHVADALRQLVDDGVDAELHIVGRTSRGGPKYEQMLRELVHSLDVGNRIRFSGFADRESLAELLSAADIFCLASYTEGWPNVVQEALACGTPVVATRVGAIPQMIPSQEYGLVVPTKDQPALLNALRMALTEEWDRDKIARWGRQRSWTDVAQRVCEVFEYVLREPAAPNLRDDGARAPGN